jgi:hypothetical protein
MGLLFRFNFGERPRPPKFQNSGKAPRALFDFGPKSAPWERKFTRDLMAPKRPLGTSASVSSAGRNLWLLAIWLEHVLKNIPLHDRYKEFTDELTNAHVSELCLER